MSFYILHSEDLEASIDIANFDDKATNMSVRLEFFCALSQNNMPMKKMASFRFLDRHLFEGIFSSEDCLTLPS